MTKTGSLAFKRLLTIALFAATSLQSFSQSNSKKMKITKQQSAPIFTINDVNGTTVNLTDFKGKKVLLTFYRNVGCPICNLRFHELQEQADYFKSKGLVLLAVYESSAENMKQYLEGENPYAIMIPNQDQSLYQLYDIDKSMGKVMKGLFHGAMGKMKKGKDLFKQKVKADGSSDRIGADFLIDENGKINTVYYGKFLGDHLPITEIKQFIN
jgi:peroxiredoxin Q/BCP